TRYDYSSDIVVVLDESGSMNDAFKGKGPVPDSFDESPLPDASNNKIGKIDAAKKIIRPFIQNRKDRLSLVIFGDCVIPLYPLSFNQEGFLRSFDAQKAPLGGTLIDIGLAQALIILRDSQAKTKIIVLISDGGGRIEEERYRIAQQMKELGVKLYWIAVDPDEYSELLMKKFIRENLNPNFAKTIPVTDQKGLAAAFEEIDKMERSLISYKEKSGGSIFVPLCLIVLTLAALFYGFAAIFND
ncbi:MAG: VWA domain-containing protein, partial [bacterium]|nr:VWA domain-containing protein [bacterium]